MRPCVSPIRFYALCIAVTWILIPPSFSAQYNDFHSQLRDLFFGPSSNTDASSPVLQTSSDGSVNEGINVTTSIGLKKAPPDLMDVNNWDYIPATFLGPVVPDPPNAPPSTSKSSSVQQYSSIDPFGNGLSATLPVSGNDLGDLTQTEDRNEFGSKRDQLAINSHSHGKSATTLNTGHIFIPLADHIAGSSLSVNPDQTRHWSDLPIRREDNYYTGSQINSQVPKLKLDNGESFAEAILLGQAKRWEWSYVSTVLDGEAGHSFSTNESSNRISCCLRLPYICSVDAVCLLESKRCHMFCECAAHPAMPHCVTVIPEIKQVMTTMERDMLTKVANDLNMSPPPQEITKTPEWKYITKPSSPEAPSKTSVQSNIAVTTEIAMSANKKHYSTILPTITSSPTPTSKTHFHSTPSFSTVSPKQLTTPALSSVVAISTPSLFPQGFNDMKTESASPSLKLNSAPITTGPRIVTSARTPTNTAHPSQFNVSLSLRINRAPTTMEPTTAKRTSQTTSSAIHSNTSPSPKLNRLPRTTRPTTTRTPQTISPTARSNVFPTHILNPALTTRPTASATTIITSTIPQTRPSPSRLETFLGTTTIVQNTSSAWSLETHTKGPNLDLVDTRQENHLFSWFRSRSNNTIPQTTLASKSTLVPKLEEIASNQSTRGEEKDLSTNTSSLTPSFQFCSTDCELNGGTCVMGNDFRPHCIIVAPDACDHFHCVNGECVSDDGFYTCECDPSWAGTFCDIPCPLDCGQFGYCSALSGKEASGGGQGQDTTNSSIIKNNSKDNNSNITAEIACVCHWNRTGPNCELTREIVPRVYEVEVPSDDFHVWQVALISILTAVALALLCVLVPYFLWRRSWLPMRKLVYYFQEYEDDDDKEFDAFVSYKSSPRDERFVLQQLYPKLEQELGFRLCLHFRDFPPGEAIANNIIHAVEQSRRTILVLSPNYISSEWCRLEYQKAQHEMLKLRHKIIPVVLEDARNVSGSGDKALRTIMDTVTYIEWPGEPSFSFPDCAPRSRPIDTIANREAAVDRFWKLLACSMPKKRKSGGVDSFALRASRIGNDLAANSTGEGARAVIAPCPLEGVRSKPRFNSHHSVAEHEVGNREFDISNPFPYQRNTKPIAHSRNHILHENEPTLPELNSFCPFRGNVLTNTQRQSDLSSISISSPDDDRCFSPRDHKKTLTPNDDLQLLREVSLKGVLTNKRISSASLKSSPKYQNSHRSPRRSPINSNRYTLNHDSSSPVDAADTKSNTVNIASKAFEDSGAGSSCSSNDNNSDSKDNSDGNSSRSGNSRVSSSISNNCSGSGNSSGSSSKSNGNTSDANSRQDVEHHHKHRTCVKKFNELSTCGMRKYQSSDDHIVEIRTIGNKMVITPRPRTFLKSSNV